MLVSSRVICTGNAVVFLRKETLLETLIIKKQYVISTKGVARVEKSIP